MPEKPTLLNEVLPTPHPSSSQSPRERVRAQMKKLLAVGSLSLLANHSQAQDPYGYEVVDPMPPPARCYSASSVHLRMKWDTRKTEEGTEETLLKLTVSHLPRHTFWSQKDPYIYGGILVDRETGHDQTLWIRLNDYFSIYSIHLYTHCPGADALLEISLQLEDGKLKSTVRDGSSD